MAWTQLFIAGLFEILWAVFLKQTHGFTRLWPSVITIFGMIFSIVFLSMALKKLPMGTAYAVWTGIGAAGTAVVGMLIFGESRELARIGCLLLIVAGIIGLKVLSS